MKWHNNRSRSHNDSNSSGYIALKEQIERLKFRRFQICVTLWLRACGYREIRSLGRHAQQGRREQGGADFLAVWPGVPNRSVAIQIRHRRTPVNRQSVDELWGFMLRNEISTGLMVTNTVFARAARKAAQRFSGRPIALLSVEEFSHSLFELGLGVTGLDHQRQVDDSFFQTLEGLRFASAPEHSTPRSPKRRTGRWPRPAVYGTSARTETEQVSDSTRLVVLVGVLAMLTVILVFLVGSH